MPLSSLPFAGRCARADLSQFVERFRASILAFAAAMALFCAGPRASAQEDLSLGEGIPSEGDTFVDTASGYDMRSGRMRRVIDDFVVAGSIGGGGLRQTRVCWTWAVPSYLDTIWTMHPWDYAPQSSTSTTSRSIIYPDGSRISFSGPTSDGVSSLKARNGDRIKLVGTTLSELWLADGTAIVFSGDRPSQVRDRHGLRIFLHYGPYGLTAAVDETGRRIDYTYTATSYYSRRKSAHVHLIQRATGSDGQWVHYSYNDKGQVASALYSDGSSASYTYTTWRGPGTSTVNHGIPEVFRDVRARARMQSIKFRFTGTLYAGQSSMSDSGLVILEESDPDTGAVVSQREDPIPSKWHNSSSIVKPYAEYTAMGMWDYRFDRKNLLSLIDPLGNQTNYTYNSASLLTALTDALGRTYAYDYEPVTNRRRKVTLPDGTYREFTFTSAAHPYHVATHRDELGRVTTYTRNSNGVITRIDYPDGTYETWSNFNAFHQAGTHRLRNGAHEWMEYDSMGRLTRRWEPSFGGQTASTTYTYYPAGHPWRDRVWTETDPRGNVTTFEYDRAYSGGVQGTTACSGRGLVTKVTHHDGTYTATAYSVYGKVVWEENELRQRTTYTYDAYNRLLTKTDPLNRVTSYDTAVQL